MAMHQITMGLLRAGCNVHVLSISSEKHPVVDQDIPTEYKEATDFETVRLDLSVRPMPALFAMMSGQSYNVQRFDSPMMHKRIRKILSENHFDIVHVESIFLAPYLSTIKDCCNAPVVLRTHNVEHQIWRRLAQNCHIPFKRGYLRHLALTLRAYECDMAPKFDAIASITNSDASFFREIAPRREVITLPFGVDVPKNNTSDAGDAPQPTIPHSVYHLGSMDWVPNIEGIQWFLRVIWPKVKSKIPDATLHLAGRHMPTDWQVPDGVKVVGEVANAKSFIEDKQLCVVPLLSGGGMRIKIIEAMSSGKCVVSTPVGAEGINITNGTNMLIGQDADEFAQQVVFALLNDQARDSIGLEAQRLVYERYDNSKLTDQLLSLYRNLLRKKQQDENEI